MSIQTKVLMKVIGVLNHIYKVADFFHTSYFYHSFMQLHMYCVRINSTKIGKGGKCKIKIS